MGYEQILFERRGRLGLITMNRSERLNAWTWRMAREKRPLTSAATKQGD